MNTKKTYIKRIHPDPPKNENQVIYRKMFVIVDNTHKPVVHKDGYLLVFYRSKDAKNWLYDNIKEGKGWRIIKMEVDITKV